MSGRLRADLVERLRETTRTTDLVIAMGTSLSGVMADSLVSSVGHRAAEEREAHPAKDRRLKPVGKDRAGGPDSISMPPSAGVVIINVQQTRLDQLSTLRIFAKLDDVLKLLSKELELSPAAPWPMKTSAQDTDMWDNLPFDSAGHPSAGECTVNLDLRQGKKVMLTHGNPPLIDAGTTGIVGPKTKQGHYTLLLDTGKRCHLGRWLLQDARKGQLPMLPVVNWDGSFSQPVCASTAAAA